MHDRSQHSRLELSLGIVTLLELLKHLYHTRRPGMLSRCSRGKS